MFRLDAAAEDACGSGSGRWRPTRSWPAWSSCPSTSASRWAGLRRRRRRAAARHRAGAGRAGRGGRAPAALRLLDRRREIDPAWFQRSRMIGYVCYADRFAGSLAGVREHLDYLAELGVTYLHLMPLLRPARRGQRRRLRGGRLRRRRSARRHHGRPAGAGRRPARARHGAVHRPGAQPHRAGSTSGPARRWPASPATGRCT